MSVFGGVSKGERNRIKVRVRAAMATQARIEGRYLGGRPPYGYKPSDAGPHPNPAKAADGKRLHALEIDDSASLAASIMLSPSGLSKLLRSVRDFARKEWPLRGSLAEVSGPADVRCR